jgi:hypothetical protein
MITYSEFEWKEKEQSFLTDKKDTGEVALDVKEEFLSREKISLLENTVDRWSLLIHYYSALAMYADEEVMEGFRKEGIPDLHLKWFIPFDWIRVEMEKIESTKHIKIDKSLFFFSIDEYLRIKINIEMSKWIKVYENHNGRPSHIFRF